MDERVEWLVRRIFGDGSGAEMIFSEDCYGLALEQYKNEQTLAQWRPFLLCFQPVLPAGTEEVQLVVHTIHEENSKPVNRYYAIRRRVVKV